MDGLYHFCCKEIKDQHFDCLAISKIDFKKETFCSFEISKNKNSFKYFDLASLSKPLNLSAWYFLNNRNFSETQKLLLNHRAGLKSWGRLDKETWEKQVLNYKINPSHTLYSDFSALRLMLDVEKEQDKDFESLVKDFRDKDLFFWKEKNNNKQPKELFVPTGIRNNQIIQGEVNDDNCFIVDQYTTHAGMFSSIEGLSRSLINLNNKTDFISLMAEDLTNNNLLEKNQKKRFINGWDSVSSSHSLAGKSKSDKIFGHLGFTGTSIWIDSDTSTGHIILSNETNKCWYDRNKLNQFRKTVGTKLWSIN